MGDFSSSRGILGRRPVIKFVEPEQVITPQEPVEEVPPTVETRKLQVEQLTSQYKRLEVLSDLAQKRVDDRAKDMRICLDPVLDADTINSLNRVFNTDVPCITYQQYKFCLSKISRAGKDVAPRVTLEDLANGKGNPFKKDFSGFNRTNGSLRPENQFDSPVKPIDTKKFQKDSVSKLFKMLLPMTTELVDSKILMHLLTAPHS